MNELDTFSAPPTAPSTTGNTTRATLMGEDLGSVRLLHPRSRRVLAVGFTALVAVMLSVLPSTAAHAWTTSPSGASAHTTLLCNGGTVAVDTSAGTMFEYRQVFVYVNDRLHSNGPWELMRSGYFSGHRSWHFVPFGRVSVWVRYADDLGGGRFSYASEWVRTSTGDYYCIA